MTNPTLWNQLLIWPILNVLVIYYKFFEWLHFPGPLGFSIILMTITIRVILYPFMAKQMKSARQMAKLKPHLDEIKNKHKEDKQALQQAQLALYKEHGINPAAGCLPLLLQMPVLIALYNVFYQVFSAGDMAKVVSDINQILYMPSLKLATIDLSFLGINLATKPSEWQTQGIWLLSVPILTGALQWYQTKLMMPENSKEPASLSLAGRQIANSKQQIKKKGTKVEEPKKEDEKPQEDMAADMQKQMAIISPLMFGFFAYQFSLGLALYWNIFGIFGIMQQRRVNKHHG